MSRLEFLSMARTQLSVVIYDLEKETDLQKIAELKERKYKLENYIKDNE